MEQKNIYNWKLVILATALSGASALIYEIITSRILLLFFSSAITSLTIVLMIFLGGLAMGSALMTIFKKHLSDYGQTFNIIQIIVAFYGILILSKYIYLPSLFNILDNFITSILLVQFISGLIFIFLPTLLLGAVFPLVVTIITEDKSQDISQRIGWLYTLDVLGAVLGSAIAGFFILPNYGNTATIILAASLNVLAALILFPRKKKSRIILLALVLIFLVISIIISQSKTSYSVNKDVAKTNQPYLKEDDVLIFPKDMVLWQKSSPWGVITITQQDGQLGKDTILHIDNRAQCSILDNDSEKLIARGALQDTNNAQVLNIGLGCGFTLSTILEANPQHVTVAEINPVVYEAADYFSDYTNDAIHDPRVDIIIEDGADLLRNTNEKYDAIIIDIENPSIAHSSPLYTAEYFQYAKEHLNPNGKLALWAYNSTDTRYLKSLLKTFQTVFDNVIFSKYEDYSFVYLFVASDGPLSPSSIDIKGSYPQILDSLNDVEDVPINTLDYPALIKYFK